MRLCKSEPKEKVSSNGGCLTGGTRVDLKVGTERERFESESALNGNGGCEAMFSLN